MENTTQKIENNNVTAENKNAAKELLLADYQYLCESFWRNEEIGETRVKFFITLVTAVLAALVTLVKSKGDSVNGDVMILISLFALFALLTIGIVTLFRIIKRNEVTDGYKKDMDEIRKRFKNRFNEHKVLSGYSPFRGPARDKKSEEEKIPPRKFGGLAHTVAAINSLILTALIGIVLYYTIINEMVLLVTNVLVAFFLFFYSQYSYIGYADKRNKAKFNTPDG